MEPRLKFKLWTTLSGSKTVEPDVFEKKKSTHVRLVEQKMEVPSINVEETKKKKLGTTNM